MTLRVSLSLARSRRLPFASSPRLLNVVSRNSRTTTAPTAATPATKMDSNCIFCKIIQGQIPSKKLAETERSFAFLDIQPLSEGHALVIPKYHGKILTDIPDEYLQDTLVVAKKIAQAYDVKDFNILQNNGSIAHQVVPHVHFHVIPKPNEEEGLGIRWPAKAVDGASLEETKKRLIEKVKL